MSMTSKGVSDTHHTYWELRHLGGPALAVLHTQCRLPAKASYPKADVSLLSVVNRIASARPAPGAEPVYDSNLLPLTPLPNRKVFFI